MRIRFLSDHRGKLTNEVFYVRGEVIDVHARIAAQLIADGFAEEVPDTPLDEQLDALDGFRNLASEIEAQEAEQFDVLAGYQKLAAPEDEDDTPEPPKEPKTVIRTIEEEIHEVSKRKSRPHR